MKSPSPPALPRRMLPGAFIAAALVLAVPADAAAGVSEGLKSPPTERQGESARQLGMGTRWTNSLGMEFVLIPPGEFEMGRANDITAPSHRVRLTRAVYLAATEVTQGQFRKVMGLAPSYFSDGGESLPVEQVGFDDALAFCARLSQREGQRYRLPTEAEWEYGCRAGGELTGGAASAAALGRSAWFDGNSGLRTHPVRTRAGNPWGLFDMLGNVAEWVQDYLHAFPTDGVAVDPVGGEWIGKPTHAQGIIRGGAWNVGAERCAPAVRTSVHQRLCWAPYIGFRVVREIDVVEEQGRK